MLQMVLAARWWPYILIGGFVLIAGGSWYVYNKGYDSGYSHMEAVHDKRTAEALAKRITVEKKVAYGDLKAVVVSATRKAGIKYAIQNVDRFIDTCDSIEQLRFFNAGVRAAATKPYTD